MNEIELLRKKLERERRAREQAEQILEQKATELYYVNQKLEESNQRLQSELLHLFENSAFGIAITKNNRIVTCNSHLSKMLGYSIEELKQMAIVDFTYQHDKKETIEVSSQLEPFEIRKRYLRKDRSIFWGQTLVTPVFNEKKELSYYLAIVKDIQYLVEIENNKQSLIETLIHQNEKLEAFAHMVSHDLKSPLRAVNSLVQWIKEDEECVFSKESCGFMNEVENRVDKMNNLIEGLLDYSTLDVKEQTETFYTKDLIKYVVNFIDTPQSFELKYKGKFPTINACYFKMQQLFQNLIDNAIKHNDKPVCRVKIEAKEDDEFYIFKVSDNGPGIPEDKYDQVFEMFKTVNNLKSNSGVGLALVKKITEQYGGKVLVESKLGEKTTFTITFLKTLLQ